MNTNYFYMKKRISLSKGCVMASIAGLAIIYLGGLVLVKFYPSVWSVLLPLLLGFLPICVLAPEYLESDGERLTLKTMMWRYRIPIDEITGVRTYLPGEDTRMVLCSCDFFGHWGVYRDRKTGYYRACYGRADEAFMITLRNGQHYLLGCDEASEMVGYIKSKMLDPLTPKR